MSVESTVHDDEPPRKPLEKFILDRLNYLRWSSWINRVIALAVVGQP